MAMPLKRKYPKRSWPVNPLWRVDGDALRQRRKLLGPYWTRKRLAEAIGYSQWHYAHLELGIKPILPRIQLLLDTFFTTEERKLRARLTAMERTIRPRLKS